MEPGEDIALIRLAREGIPKHRTVHIVITVRKKDFRDLIGATRLKAALLDFDGTFTRIGKMYSSAMNGKVQYQTGWQELRRKLPPEGHRALDRHYTLYKRGDITPLEWLYISVACYQEYGLTLDDVIATAGSVPFRSGYGEFIALLNANFKKSFIISFGMKDWIDCRKEFDNFPHQTVASCLLADPKGRITGVEAGVTEDTKGKVAKKLLRQNGWKAEEAFALGNSWHDRHLFEAAGISAYLSHGGYKGSGIDHAAEIERLRGIATAIIFDDTLCGVNDFMAHVLAKTIPE